MLTEEREFTLVTQLRNMYNLARNEKRKKYANWSRNYKLMNQESSVMQGISGLPTPKSSEIYPILSSLVAWKCDQETTFNFYPVAPPGSPYFNQAVNTCTDLEAVMNAVWAMTNNDREKKIMLWDTYMYGVGIVKTIWDAQADDGLGLPRIKRIDPYSFFWDPNATSCEDAEYFVEVNRMSFAEVERRYPNSHLLIGESGGEFDSVASRSDSMSAPRNIGKIPTSGTTGALGSSAYNTSFSKGGNSANFPVPDTVTVYEFWIKENEPFEHMDEDHDPDSPDPESFIEYKECWRVIAVAANQILLNEKAEDLWSCATHPYSRYVYDDIGEFVGIALVDHLAHPQVYINRLLTAAQQNTELTGNPIFMEPTNSGTDRVNIINRPGGRLKITPNAANGGGKPDWLRPPEPPRILMELIQFWSARLESISGLTAVTKGASPGHRNAEGVINTIQEAAFVRIRAGLSNLQETITDVMRKMTELVIDNFDSPRMMASLGPDGTPRLSELRANHFLVPIESPDGERKAPLKYFMSVDCGATSPTSRQSRIAEADKLFTLQAIDDEALLSIHKFPHFQEVIARVNQKKQAGLMQQQSGRKRAGRTS